MSNKQRGLSLIVNKEKKNNLHIMNVVAKPKIPLKNHQPPIKRGFNLKPKTRKAE